MKDEVLEAYGERVFDDVSYWVYVLECRPTEWEYEDIQRRAESRLGEEPWWLRPAFEHDRQYYVGQTENLFKRLGQHFEKHNSSEFTQLFEPTEVVKLRPAHTRNQAERIEGQTVDGYKQSDRVFAYGY